MKFEKKEVEIKSGQEPLTFNNRALEFLLMDFWRWSVSDILSNATRGRFAEFIVAKAMNLDKSAVREEWSPYDLESNEGIKVEVKSAAYIQSWHQKALSRISFSTKASFYWDSSIMQISHEKKRHADVYVFCLLHHEDKRTIDPLNMNQWEFYVLATRDLNAYTRSQHSLTLKSLKKLTAAVPYDQLYNAIKEEYFNPNKDE